MADELGEGFTVFKIRTKINNDRKKHDELIKQRIDDLNID